MTIEKRLNKVERELEELRTLLGRTIDVIADLVKGGALTSGTESKGWGLLRDPNPQERLIRK
jgi:hypothetical protein